MHFKCCPARGLASIHPPWRFFGLVRPPLFQLIVQFLAGPSAQDFLLSAMLVGRVCVAKSRCVCSAHVWPGADDRFVPGIAIQEGCGANRDTSPALPN